MIARLTGERRASKAWAIAVVCASVVAMVGAPRTAAAQDELRIARVSRSAGVDTEVLVSVPRALSGRTLPSSAFTVTVDGSAVATTATRESGRGYDAVLVIETSATADEPRFVATKAAVVEFVLQLPSESRVAVVASDPPAVVLDYSADRAAVVRAVRELARAPGTSLAAALELAATKNDATNRATIVTAATAADTTLPAAALMGNQVSALRRAASQLFAVGVVGDPLAQLAADSGGIARTADVRQLVGAFDAVAADLAGRYRLAFAVPPDAARLDVRVTAPAASGAATVTLSAGAGKNVGAPSTTSPPPTATPGTDNGVSAARSANDESNDLSALTVALIIGLLAAGVLIVLLAVRSRRRPQPARSPATIGPPAVVLPPLQPPPPAAPPPLVDLRHEEVGAPDPLAGYSLTALCSDAEAAELRAAVASYGIAVTQARMVDDVLREVVAGRTRAVYIDSAMPLARELATAVRQRNDARWSSCRLLVHVSSNGIIDPTLMAMADAIITSPIVASHVVELLAKHVPTTARSIH